MSNLETRVEPIEGVADAVLGRSRAGKRFSIIAMAEGALSQEEAAAQAKAESRGDGHEPAGCR